ncbi:MAG: acetate--CoA ligase family protein [Proteobacteria bacterium]|nr:acetate--CoA ligase family protein [Pseudomonadota bacterium]
MARLREAAALLRVALAIDDATAASDVARVLAARGIASEPVSIENVWENPSRPTRHVIAYAPEDPPDPELAARIAPFCRATAAAGSPVLALCSYARGSGRAADERAAALAYLRCSGMVICDDPDVWIESICLTAGHGLPDGPRVAVVAPPGSWLAASACALGNEAQLMGNRFPMIATSTKRLEPTDVALVDSAALSPSTPDHVGQTRVVPIVARAELLSDSTRLPLVGLRAAMGAVAAAGDLTRRMAEGLGPAPSTRDDSAQLEQYQPDLERFQRQLGKLDALDTRAGDHEAKVLLASWGIDVIRQAVATTPSAATRVAKRAGYPVEVKPWGPDQLSEREGCPIQRDLHTAADVRRAFAAVTKAAGLPAGAPVIVRATPPRGREVYARITRVGHLGWIVHAVIEGAPEPIAAPAPLQLIDADSIARRVEASRATDPEPDRQALADILIRASHLVVHHSDVIEALYLHRIIVTPQTETTLVADAQAVLGPRK